LAQYARGNRAASGPLVGLRRLSGETSDTLEKEAGYFEGFLNPSQISEGRA
jgi:hypothetical protein